MVYIRRSKLSLINGEVNSIKLYGDDNAVVTMKLTVWQS
jgi:hypothetical protein